MCLRRLDDLGCFPAGQGLKNVQAGYGDSTASYLVSTGRFYLQGSRGVKLTTYLCLVQMLAMKRAVLLLLCALVAWTGTTLPFLSV
jgi:hypothetical protein